MSGEVCRKNHRNIKRYRRMCHAHYSSKVRIASLPRKRRHVNKTQKSSQFLFSCEFLNFPRNFPYYIRATAGQLYRGRMGKLKEFHFRLQTQSSAVPDTKIRKITEKRRNSEEFSAVGEIFERPRPRTHKGPGNEADYSDRE